MGTLFITGGNRGLGLEIVKKFASEKYNIIVTTRKQYVDFELFCRKLEKDNGITIYHLYMDLASRDSIADGLRQFYELNIIPTVVVNNVSMPFDRTTLMCKLSDLDMCFQVNYFSTVQIVQGVVKKMLRCGGSVVNISSVSSMTKQSAGVGYSASKAALNVFTTSLAQELAPFKIRVNAVAPGGMNTEMFQQTNEANKNALIGSTALKRIGEPQEVADVVYFLASNQSTYINGQIIRVDGGLIL